MRRQHIGVLAGAAALATWVLMASTVTAQVGQVSPQYQGYGTAAGSQDPYANSNPQDVHVDGYGGQRVVTGYVKLNLDSLPQGSNIDGLKLSLTPNSSTSDNVNTSTASIAACVLTTPLTSNGYQASPPADDCTLPHAVGALQPNGDWHFEIAPLAQYWAKNQNTGLALVAYPPPNDTGLPVDPSAWAIGFDHTKTTATVDYTPGSSSDIFAPTPPSSSSFGSASTGPALAPTVVLPDVQPAPQPSTAPAVATAVPSAAPSAAPAQAPVGGSATTNSPRLAQQWVWLTIALGGATLLLLVVGASQQLLRGGRLNLGAAAAALSASRSQLATPIATLALGAVFALGFSGQLASASGGSPGALGGGNGSAATGTGSGNGAGPSAGTGPGGGPSGAAAPGGGSGGPGATAGTSGGGAVASNGNTIGGANGVGVTATTVRIGFIHITNTQSANQAFGVNVPNPGDGQAEEQALVDYVNKHGGLGGRQIDPVYVAVDNAKAESDSTIGEETCKQLTEDDHVWAVVAGGGAPDAIASDACYAQHGTLNLDSADSGMSLAFLRQASPYIFMNQAVALDRGMRWEVAGLQSRNFFSNAPTYKLGVVVAGDSMNDNIYDQVTKPAALAAGVNAASIEKFDVPHDTISDIANTMKQAVIRFQADGVTNVMFQGGANYGQGSYALLFMINAESQHYNPRYGLSTDDAPIALVGSVPQDQFQNAVAVGWMPAADTDDQHYQPWPYTAGEKNCASIEAAAGNSFTSREGAIAILAFCSDMFELQLGAQGLTTLNAQLWANHVMQLGNGVGNVLMYRGYVGPDHWDAAGGYRLLHAVQNCEQDSNGKSIACFEYDNGNVYGG